MRIVDITVKFKDNAIMYKTQRRRLWHWSGSKTASSAINWLDKRANGEGTVGYNYIIDKNGTIFILADPKINFMQSSGKGKYYDSTCIAICFVMKDETELITYEQIQSARYLIKKTDEDFDIIGDTHHAKVNSNKCDFPIWLWRDLKVKLKI